MSVETSHTKGYAIPVKSFFSNSANVDISLGESWLNLNDFFETSNFDIPKKIDLIHPERSLWCTQDDSSSHNSELTILALSGILHALGWKSGLSEDHKHYHDLNPFGHHVVEADDVGCISTSAKKGFILSNDATAKENNCYFASSSYSELSIFIRAAIQSKFDDIQTFGIVHEFYENENDEPKELDVDVKKTIDVMMSNERKYTHDFCIVRRLLNAEFHSRSEYSEKLDEKEVWFGPSDCDFLTSADYGLEDLGGMNSNECYIVFGLQQLEPGVAWEDPLEDEDSKKTIESVLELKGLRLEDLQIVEPQYRG
jgi:hypothetical protein